MKNYDAATDPFCYGYNTAARFTEPYDIRDWKLLGCLEDPQVQENNLSGPIHPILDFPAWHNGFPDEVKAAMRPVLRLATAMLLSAGSVSFIDALIYERRSKIGERGDQDLTVLPGPSIYSKILKVEIDNFLTSLCMYVSLKFADWESDKWRIEPGTLAYTDTDNETPVYLFPGSGCDFGYGSNITIAGAFVNTLCAIHDTRKTAQEINHLLRVQFLLAVTICHELMHAVDTAIQEDPQLLEPHFEDQALNELGWAWEQVVFGGVIDAVEEKGPLDYIDREMCHWPLFFSRFPSPKHYQSGLEPELPSPQRTIFERKPAKGLFTQYYLPMRWISRLQQQSTWDDWEQSTNPKWLHIPKRVGTQRRNVVWEIDPNWRTSKCSEDEWPGCHGKSRRIIQIGWDRLDFKDPLDVKKAERDAFERAIAETQARWLARKAGK